MPPQIINISQVVNQADRRLNAIYPKCIIGSQKLEITTAGLLICTFNNNAETTVEDSAQSQDTLQQVRLLRDRGHLQEAQKKLREETHTILSINKPYETDQVLFNHLVEALNIDGGLKAMFLTEFGINLRLLNQTEEAQKAFMWAIKFALEEKDLNLYTTALVHEAILNKSIKYSNEGVDLAVLGWELAKSLNRNDLGWVYTQMLLCVHSNPHTSLTELIKYSAKNDELTYLTDALNYLQTRFLARFKRYISN